MSTADIERLHRAAPVTADLLRRVCGHFVTGVTVVTSGLGEQSVGTTVNSFTSVSLEPPLVLFCLHNQSRLREAIEDTRAYVVNFLEGRQERLARAFAGQNRVNVKDVAHHSSAVGVPVLSEALTFLVCELVNAFDAGDHTIFLGKVVELGAPRPDLDPLIFFRGSLGALEDQPRDIHSIIDG